MSRVDLLIGLLVASFFGAAVIAFRSGEKERIDQLEKELEVARELKRTCDLRMISLYHGQCAVVTKEVCERTWASFDSRVTSMHGIAPIGCPLAGSVPWVNPRGPDPDEWSFVCTPEVAP